jgi:riboflavin synthase
MFTGIIKEVGEIADVQPFNGGQEMAVTCDLAQKLHVDQSICINGVCHTVINVQNSTFKVQTVKETLLKTTIGELNTGDRVNLEPSLRADQPMDGHIVQGHVDTTEQIKSIKEDKKDRIFRVNYPDKFKDLVVPRGSITLNGISLTIAKIDDDCFSVAIIPYTYHHTTMYEQKTGSRINIEFDILGKYVNRYLKRHHSIPQL